MSVLDKKLRRDARKSWVMLVAVSAIIAVGIGCFIAMMSAWRNLEQARDHYYGSCRLADFWIDLKKAPVGEVVVVVAVVVVMVVVGVVVTAPPRTTRVVKCPFF